MMRKKRKTKINGDSENDGGIGGSGEQIPPTEETSNEPSKDKPITPPQNEKE